MYEDIIDVESSDLDRSFFIDVLNLPNYSLKSSLRIRDLHASSMLLHYNSSIDLSDRLIIT